MSSKRRNFSASEKYKVALEAIKGDLKNAEISSKYKVHVTQINKWKKQALDYLASSFSGKPNQQEDNGKELAELYQQMGKLKVENDFLKKNVICLATNKHELLEPDHTELSLRAQCELLGVNRSSYYYKRYCQMKKHGCSCG